MDVINHLLSDAAKLGNLEHVKLLVNRGANIETRTKTGDTPLSLASFMGHNHVVRWLLENGANTETTEENDLTPLILAEMTGHTNVVESLLAFKANTEKSDSDGDTPLIIACLMKYTGIVQLLLEYGAATETKNDIGFFPLFFAALEGHEQIVRLLLNRGANIEKKTQGGCTAVGISSTKLTRHVLNTPIGSFEYIRSTRANLLLGIVGTPGGLTALSIASWKGHTGTVQLLLGYKAHIEARDSDGDTPLSIASLNGHTNVVKLLLEANADIETKDDNGFFPLYIAAQKGHKKIVRLLLNRRANTETTIPSGCTALMIASQHGHTGVVQLLLDRGANTAVKDRQGRTPLAIARSEGHSDVEHLLMLAELNASLVIASAKGNIYEVSLLLKKGANIEARDADGNTPLCRASFKGHYNVVELLLKRGADVEATNYDGFFPLYFAAKNNHVRVTGILLDNRATIDNYVASPLHVSTQCGHVAILGRLLSSGRADIGRKDNAGRCPLLCAALYGQKDEILKLLIDHGANCESRDNDGLSALEISVKHGHVDTVKYFMGRIGKQKRTAVAKQMISLAAEYGKKDVIAYLFKFIPLERRNDFAKQMVSLADKYGQIGVISSLFETFAGISLDYKGSSGLPALINSVISGVAKNVVEYIACILDEERRINVAKQLVSLAEKHEQIGVIYNIIKSVTGLSLDLEGSTGLSALVTYVIRGLVKSVLDFLAGITDEGRKRWIIECVLPIAADYGHTCVISSIALSVPKVNLDFIDESGLTPFAKAVFHSHFDCVRLLHSQGATWGAIGPDKQRDYIMQSRSIDIYEYLLLTGLYTPTGTMVHDCFCFGTDINWSVIEQSLLLGKQSGISMNKLSSFVSIKGVGSVTMLGGTRNELMQAIEKKVGDLTKTACIHWNIIAPRLVGSSAESSKVGLPDEMDFKFQQGRDVSVDELEDVGHVFRKISFKNERGLRENSKLFHSAFWNDIPSVKDDMVSFWPPAVTDDGTASSPMKMVWPKNDVRPSLIVDIDLVPSHHVNDWPKDAIHKTWMMNRDGLREIGYELVAKPPAKNSEFGKRLPGDDREKMYTISFTNLEVKHISVLDKRVKNAYILAKCLRNPVVCGVVVRDEDRTIQFVHNLISSYLIKTVFLHNVASFLQHKRPLIEMAYIIYSQLEYYLSHGFLPLFWMPRINLLEGYKINTAKSHKVTTHIKHFLAKAYRDELNKDPPVDLINKTLITKYDSTSIDLSDASKIQILSIPLKRVKMKYLLTHPMQFFTSRTNTVYIICLSLFILAMAYIVKIFLLPEMPTWTT